MNIAVWCWTYFLNSVSHSDTWNRLWVMNLKVLRFWCVDFVNVWSQIFVFARISFTFLIGAGQLSWCRAHGKLCRCASTETQCHRQIPAAGIYKYAILLTILSGICTVVQRKPFIRALWCVSHVLHVLLCATTARVLLWLPSLPVFEEVWFWVLLNSIGYLLHLPCAALAPSPALNSVWRFGSKELFSPTDLDLHLGNSGEGKQPPGSGRCLVRTPDRRRGHPALDLLMMGLLSIASIGQWAQGGSGCCRGAKGCGQEVLWGWWGNPLRQRTSVEIFLRSREECKNRGR